MAGVGWSASVLGSVLRSRSLRHALLGYLTFNAAESGGWLALLVYAHEVGGTTATGVVAVVVLVPSILVAPLGSVLGDRMPRPRALALGCLLQAAGSGATALALLLHAPPIVVFAFAIVGACAETLTRPVYNALLPALANTPEELMASNSASSTVEGLGIILGPLVTSLLLALANVGAVFALFSASMLAAGLIALTIHPSAALGTEDTPEPSVIVAGAFRGFSEVRRQKGAALLLLLVGAQFVVVGMLDILVVALAVDALGMGPSGPGLLSSATGVGGLIGAAATVLLIGRRRMSPAFALGALTTGIPLILIAGSSVAAIAIGLMALSGIGKSFVDVAGCTLLQRSVKDDVLARVFGVQEAVMMLALLIGSGAVPLLVHAFGPRGAFVAAGAFLPVLALAGWRPLAALDRRASPPDPERLAILRALPLFRPLAPPVLERVAQHLVPLRLAAGEVIIREGDAGDRFYVLVEGQARVTAGGREVARPGPGDFVGEIALLRDVPRTATVTAVSDVRLYALARQEFLAAVTGSRPSTVAANEAVDRRLDELRDSG